MIAVIADDFTGAAEIGGIGLRHGLKVIIETEVNNPVGFDLLVIATDTRSMSQTEAAEVTRKITCDVLKLNPDLVFKKIDSALRGNISIELDAFLHTANKDKIYLIAANPVFQRIIRNGYYTIDGVPLHETRFACDPEFPVQTSVVNEIITERNFEVITGLTPWDHLPEKGIIAGDVRNFGDLEAWAALAIKDKFIAGASGFFNAILQQINSTQKTDTLKPDNDPKKELYVLGSTFNHKSEFLSGIAQHGFLVSNMPDEIYFNKNFSDVWIDFWADEIIAGLQTHPKVFASVSHEMSDEPGISVRIKDTIGRVIQKVLKKQTGCNLIIEGGGTTSVILNHLGVKKLYPMLEIDTGIIQMKIDEIPEIIITTKPGSYQWPQSFLNLKTNTLLT